MEMPPGQRERAKPLAWDQDVDFRSSHRLCGRAFFTRASAEPAQRGAATTRSGLGAETIATQGCGPDGRVPDAGEVMFMRRTPRRRSARLGWERLEDRLAPSLTIQFDYSLDSSGFFTQHP